MQLKHLAKMLGDTSTGSKEERYAAKLLLQWVLTGARELEEEGSLLDDMLTVENKTAASGCDRCECGCKYWENDRCIDCGTKHEPRHKHVEEAS